jgi:hypothetical protein
MSPKYGEPGWWGGARATKAGAYCKRVYGWTCWLCGHAIAPDDYTVDHVIERSVRPDLTWEPSNWRPAHGRKHPEWDCPGNKGRSGRAVTYFTEPGW